MANPTQRDAFWEALYEIAFHDRNTYLVCADMGAPALDKFRRDLTNQYIDVGIAEQQGAAVAAGLALEGKKVYVYAIAPFITMRCYEHSRVNLSTMNLPVTLVGVGSGVSYDDSGPTHHTVDDLSIMRILPHFTVHNCTDAVMAAALADISHKATGPDYVRLDRGKLDEVYDEGQDFTDGLAVVEPGDQICLVATGNMVQRAREVSAELAKRSISAGVVDVYRLPINGPKLVDAVSSAGRIFTMEEHSLPGGLGSAVCEVLADAGVMKPIKRIGMNFSDGYCYKYGGRENIQSLYGLDAGSIVETVVGSM